MTCKCLIEMAGRPLPDDLTAHTLACLLSMTPDAPHKTDWLKQARRVGWVGTWARKSNDKTETEETA